MKGKKLWLRWVLLSVGSSAALVAVGVMAGVQWSESKLQREKELARAAGMPTSMDEFLAMLPTVKPEDNAAPLFVDLYREEKTPPFPKAPSGKHLLAGLRSQTVTVAQAKITLRAQAKELEILEQAATKSGCRFDREWEQGADLPLPEYASIQSGCHILATRAWVAMREDRHEDAGRDLQRIHQIGNLLMQEPTETAQLVTFAGWYSAFRVAADGLVRNPNNPVYREFLSELKAESVKDRKHLIASEGLFLDRLYQTLHEGKGKAFGLDVQSEPDWMNTALGTPIRNFGRAAGWQAARLRTESLKVPLGPQSRAMLTASSKARKRSLLAIPGKTHSITLMSDISPDIRTRWARFRTLIDATVAAVESRKKVEMVSPDSDEIRATAVWKGTRLEVTAPGPEGERLRYAIPEDPPKPVY